MEETNPVGKVLVTGFSGILTSRIILRLMKSGYPDVRVGTKHPDKAETLSKEGADVVFFDWDKKESYKKALAGVETVLCVLPYVIDREKKPWVEDLVNASKSAGVKHIVKLSVDQAILHKCPIAALHHEYDQVIIDSGIPFTIISATHLMSDPMRFQGKNILKDIKPAPMYGSSRGHGVLYVSPNDVAEVAVRVILERSAHENKLYSLTSSKTMLEKDVADLLSKHLSKPVMYVDQSLHTFKDTEEMCGEPQIHIENLVCVEETKASGEEEDTMLISNDIQNICNHPPETFEEYLNATEYLTQIENPTA